MRTHPATTLKMTFFVILSVPIPEDWEKLLGGRKEKEGQEGIEIKQNTVMSDSQRTQKHIYNSSMWHQIVCVHEFGTKL
jgi:hypothetical protein